MQVLRHDAAVQADLLGANRQPPTLGETQKQRSIQEVTMRHAMEILEARNNSRVDLETFPGAQPSSPPAASAAPQLEARGTSGVVSFALDAEPSESRPMSEVK